MQNDERPTQTTETNAFRIRQSPFKNDDAIFIESFCSADSDVLIALSKYDGKIYLENRHLEAEVSFPVAVIPLVMEVLRKLSVQMQNPSTETTDRPLQKLVDTPFKTGGGGLIGAAMLLALFAVLFIFALIYVSARHGI